MSSPSPSRVLTAFRSWNRFAGRGHFHGPLGVTREGIAKGEIDDSDVHVDSTGKNVTWRGNVSPSLVRKNGRLEMPAVLALFDEISTWVFFTGDKTSRPGVSVKLSATLADGISTQDLPRVGENIEVRASFVQSGRTLGFATAQLVDGGSGKLLASGDHHKHLPMSAMNPFWDTLFSPPLKSGAIWYLNDQAKRAASSRPSVSCPESLEDLFGDAFSRTDDDDGSSIFSADIHHCNPMGSMHGGFTAMLGAESAGIAPHCRSLVCSYIGAGKRGKQLRTAVEHRTASSSLGQGNVALAQVFCDEKSKDKPIFAAEYHY